MEMEKGGIYGRKNAKGTILKYGRLRSAAADWSVYPVGTLFRIKGQPYIYEVDDYGSALVGTRTIDLYKPTLSSMRDWGVRHVDIEILRFGSYKQSLDILTPREKKASHVRKMASVIRGKI
jgi:3D (Asp-Asp-Asp) domain-containing protein